MDEAALSTMKLSFKHRQQRRNAFVSAVDIFLANVSHADISETNSRILPHS